MDNLLRSTSFGPYREAIAAILRMESVGNLEEIRKGCNYDAQMSLVSYLETVPVDQKETAYLISSLMTMN